MISGRLANLSGASKGLLAIIGGTGAGQLVALLAAPVLSRLFEPAVFGPFAVLNAFLLPAATVSALRYELAIPIPSRVRNSRALASLALGIVGVLTALTFGLLLLCHEVVGSWVGLRTDDTSLLLWAPIVAGLMGVFIVLNQVAIRARLYSAIARRNLLQAVATTVFQILAGLAGLGAHGLAAGLACGQAVGVVALLHSLRSQFRERPSWVAMRRLAKEFRSFPLLMAPSGLINNLGIQLPVLLAGSLFGGEVAGWLGMTQRILVLPVSLLGMATAQVFLGEFGAAHRAGGADLMRLFNVASKRLALVGLAIAVVLLVAGPFIFPLVLGRQWEQSGVYAQALATGMAAQMIATPLSQAIIVTRRVGLQAVWDVSRLLVVGAAMVLGARLLGSPEATMWLLALSLVVTYAALWLLARYSVSTAHRVAGRPKHAAR